MKAKQTFSKKSIEVIFRSYYSILLNNTGGQLCNNMHFIDFRCYSVTSTLEYRFLPLALANTRSCPTCQNNAIWVNIHVSGLKTF